MAKGGWVEAECQDGDGARPRAKEPLTPRVLGRVGAAEAEFGPTAATTRHIEGKHVGR